MTNLQNYRAAIRSLATICLTFLFLSLSSCAASDNEPGSENYDDRNIYIIDGGDWQFQAATARNLETAKDVKGNIDFACDELPFGYYRALISVIGQNGEGGSAPLSYCVFTLDQQFDVVGMMTPDQYYVAERQGDGYTLRKAEEYADGVPANFINSPATRGSEDFHLRIIDALLEFQKYAKSVSTIETVDWPAMLNKIKSGDTKPSSENQNYLLAYPALLKYEIEDRLNDSLRPVIDALNYGFVAGVESAETVGGKLRVNIGLSSYKESLSDNVLGELACGIVLYDFYDREHTSPIWYPAKDVTDYYTDIEYDNLPAPGTEYKVSAYVINKKYVSPYDSGVMHPDMIAVDLDRYLQTTFLPANSISVTGISSEKIIQPEDPNSGDQYISVKGHASCNMPDDHTWGIGYAWISEYDYANPDYTPSKVWEQERLGGATFDGSVKDTDFEIRVNIDKSKLDMDYSKYVAKGYLLLFIVDAQGNGIGSSDKTLWTYSHKPHVEFTEATIKDNQLSFKYKCDGSLWFDPQIVVSDQFTYQGDLKWMLPSSYNSILPKTSHSDRVYEASHSTFSAMRFLFLDNTFSKASDVPDYAYIRYDIQGKQHRSANALKFKAEEVVTGTEPGGPFQDPVEVKEIRITDVKIVP